MARSSQATSPVAKPPRKNTTTDGSVIRSGSRLVSRSMKVSTTRTAAKVKYTAKRATRMPSGSPCASSAKVHSTRTESAAVRASTSAWRTENLAPQCRQRPRSKK